ncbi:lamin tail domain-containing protein [Rubellicoccus peritrichatus]|uniref:Lamin tail domain-containing protein n=1 Tax=Rubellicoccus peritrichatus TaxID=3080537 RepID=A0AAQ3LAM6_9BACT|nr:lamin tail domain-containing protein [Puniceicoccus sp. CR14]WOO42629.1 lamin tail domain-containing protein [Puniceicoccus sp. CR14]
MMKTLLNTILATSLTTLIALDLSAQVTKEAEGTRTIETAGPGNSNEFYAQNASSNFDEYSVAEFTFSKADFGGSDVSAITAATLKLVVNDRTFSANGPFSIFFTTDSKSDLSGGSDYDQIAFDSSSAFGIDLSTYTYNPVVVGTDTYDFDGTTGGGTEVTVTLDFSSIESDVLSAINTGDSFHLLIGINSSDGTAATFSGVGNTFDPGVPELTITATTSGILPEPSNYPSTFAATPKFTSIDLSWVDAAGTQAPIGYLILASDTNSFTAPTDGTTPASDTDLSDGSALIYVDQGVQTANFSGLSETTEYFFTIYPYTNLSTDTNYKTDGTPPSTSATTESSPAGTVLITQYYEGTSNNKYLELTNTTASQIDLTGFIIATWNNSGGIDNTDGWRTAGGTPNNIQDLAGLSIAAGGTIVIANPNAVSPIDAADADATGDATFFNGDDTIAIYASATASPSAIVDIIPFSASREGGETSFVRTLTDPGYNLAAPSTVLDFPTIWQEVSTAAVDSSVIGDDAFLGTSLLGNSPPSVSFVSSSLVVAEDSGTVALEVILLNPDNNAVSVDVVFDGSTSTGTTADINNYTTQTVNFGASASSGDKQTVTITLTDDGTQETFETVSFNLENLVTSGAASIGAASSATITIQDDDTPVPALIISEFVDPADNVEARYVELYNASGSSIDLTAGNWTLIYYANANTTGTEIALTGTLAAGDTYIIAHDSTAFATAFPSAPVPDIESGVINSNGDDNLELRFGGGTTTGILVDVYGQPGTDGTGQPWEFADSRAFRLDTVTSGNTFWTAVEWTISTANVADATPGVHPETFIAIPTAVTAVSTGSSSTSVSFTPSGGNDVLIIFNTTGTFTTPTGAVPAAGQAFAGGTVLSKGQISPQSHTNLVAGTEIFYALFSVSNADEYSASVTVSATPGAINSEDFNGTSTWINQTVSGVSDWSTSGGNASADGFGGDADENHYLVSPVLDFSSGVDFTISFDYGEAFDGPNLELLYSTNYSGSGDPEASGVIWTSVGFTFNDTSTTAAFSSFSSGDVALPASLEGESTVYLAFKYTADGTDTGSEQWQIDNIIVKGSEAAGDPLGNWLTDNSLTLADLETDFDNNGLVALLEYLADLDPNGLESLNLSVELNSSDQLVLTFISNRDSQPGGVTIDLMGSDNLTGYTSVGFSFAAVDNGNGTHTHRYTQTTTLTAGGMPFLTLDVTVAP